MKRFQCLINTNNSHAYECNCTPSMKVDEPDDRRSTYGSAYNSYKTMINKNGNLHDFYKWRNCK